MVPSALWALIFLAWPGPAERQAEVERLRADPTYQTTLPITDAGVPRGDSGPDEALPPRTRRSRDAGEGIAGTLLWFIIGLTGLAIAVVVVREFATRPARVKTTPAVEADLPLVRLEAGTLDDAEDLANKGLFGEAIHVLLLRTFAAIGRQALLPDALTSREILGRVAMQPEARAALAQLVQAVEVSFFGTTEPGMEDFERCRASYRQVTATRGVQVS